MNLSYLECLRKFARDALTDARHAPESVRRELEAAYQRADADYRRAFFGMKRVTP